MFPVKTSLKTNPLTGDILADTGALAGPVTQIAILAYNDSVPALFDLVVLDVGGGNLLSQRIITLSAATFMVVLPMSLSLGQRAQAVLAADYMGKVQVSLCLM